MKRRKFLEMTSMASSAVATSLYFPQSYDQKKIKIGLIGSGWYALQFIAACDKGLDIYCEKPLAYDVNRDFNNGIFFYGEKGIIFAEDSKLLKRGYRGRYLHP